MNKIALKPCPFCQHTPEDWRDFLHPTGAGWRDDDFGNGKFRHYMRRDDKRGIHGECWELGCLTHEGGCGATVYGDSRDEAIAAWNRRACIEAVISAPSPGAQEALPADGAYLIVFDDQDMDTEVFSMTGAREAALERFAQISDNWNAHLYAKIKSSSKLCEIPNSSFTTSSTQAAPKRVISGKDLLARLLANHPSNTRAGDGGHYGFIREVLAARQVWMDENRCEDGHDHVTPFDQFLYGTPEDHVLHGKDAPGEGPDDPDCPCRGTMFQEGCASEGCGFCRAAQRGSVDD